MGMTYMGLSVTLGSQLNCKQSVNRCRELTCSQVHRVDEVKETLDDQYKPRSVPLAPSWSSGRDHMKHFSTILTTNGV